MPELKRLLKRDWPYILIVAGLFVLGVWLGQFLPRLFPKLAKLINKEALEKFAQLASLLKDAPFLSWILVIFANNLGVSVYLLLTGLLFPLLPVIFLLQNALLISLFQKSDSLKIAPNAWAYYLSLLPHGIFELSAVFIVTFLGFRFGLIPYRLIWHYYKTKEHQPFFRVFLTELRYYGVFIISLLLIAATVEVLVSPAVAMALGIKG